MCTYAIQIHKQEAEIWPFCWRKNNLKHIQALMRYDVTQWQSWNINHWDKWWWKANIYCGYRMRNYYVLIVLDIPYDNIKHQKWYYSIGSFFLWMWKRHINHINKLNCNYVAFSVSDIVMLESGPNDCMTPSLYWIRME